MTHGTVGGYTNHGCRCEECRHAKARDQRQYGGGPAVEIDRTLFGDLLSELFPHGLTDDCPARKAAA